MTADAFQNIDQIESRLWEAADQDARRQGGEDETYQAGRRGVDGGADKADAPRASRDTVLMLDARNIYRKVTRKIYDFSPEQLANLTAIVWLYRGQTERLLNLVKSYCGKVCTEEAAIPGELETFDATLAELHTQFTMFADSVKDLDTLTAEQQQLLTAALAELAEATTAYRIDRAGLVEALAAFRTQYEAVLPQDNATQHTARNAFHPIADKIEGLVKQVDLLYKLAARLGQLA